MGIEILYAGLIVNILLLLCLWLDGSRRDHVHDASLRAIQMQLAFIAGRIGLRNQDLVRAVEHPDPQSEDVKTSAEGPFGEWNEAKSLDEMIYDEMQGGSGGDGGKQS